MSRFLLKDPNTKFLLLGHFQSDCIEGEFGCYREMFGGLYHIAFEQILNAAKCRRLKFLQDLDLLNTVAYESSASLSGCSSCQNIELSEDEWNLIDEAPNGAHILSTEERSLLFYIASYIAKKRRPTM